MLETLFIYPWLDMSLFPRKFRSISDALFCSSSTRISTSSSSISLSTRYRFVRILFSFRHNHFNCLGTFSLSISIELMPQLLHHNSAMGLLHAVRTSILNPSDGILLLMRSKCMTLEVLCRNGTMHCTPATLVSLKPLAANFRSSCYLSFPGRKTTSYGRRGHLYRDVKNQCNYYWQHRDLAAPNPRR